MRPFSDFLFFAWLFVLSTSSAHAAAVVINHPPSSSNLVLTNNPDASFPYTSLPANRTIYGPQKCVDADPAPPDSSSPSADIEKKSPSTLPHSPYVYRVPNDHKTVITFFDYSGAVSELYAVEVMLVANEDIRAALVDALREHDPDRLMPQGYLRVDAMHASLVVTTIDRQMKWVTCSQTLAALRAFLGRWEYIGLSFAVEVEGARVGMGVLAGR